MQMHIVFFGNITIDTNCYLRKALLKSKSKEKDEDRDTYFPPLP